MTKAPISYLQELRRKIYVKAKAEPQWRFWGLYTHVCKTEVLIEAYTLAKQNNGAPGLDGVTFEEIEAKGLAAFIKALRADLQANTYKPAKARKVKIPKADGKRFRELSIPSIRDRIVQGAVKLILEPIFEADFQEGSYGYRPKRQAKDAIDRASQAIVKERKTRIIDLDISKFFDTVRHDFLLRKIALRVQDNEVMHLVKLILKSTGNQALPQGGPLSPLMSNVYLNDIDKMLEKAKQVTAREGKTNLEYVRWADDAVIMIDHFKRHELLVNLVMKRLREELDKLGLQMNEQKTKVVNLSDHNQSFAFLGFDFRMCASTKGGDPWLKKVPRRQAQVKLQQKLKAIFKAKRGRPIAEVIDIINPILQGWVNYFRIGNSYHCFKAVKDWTGKKVRRHIYRAKQKSGFGWKRWSKEQLHQYTGLYNDYQIRYSS